MKLKWFSLTVFVLFLGTFLLVTANAYCAPQEPRYGQDNDRGGWDAPPREFREIQRQGFRDGIEGFRRDMDNHRRPDVNNRDEYRNPRVPYRAKREYREGFRRGYEVAMSKLYNVAPEGPPSRGHDRDGNNGGWDAAPGEFREVQRQGFRDGMEGFRRDMDNHRRPDVNNRDEYRHPHVPFRDQADYLEGFRRGYDAAYRHSMGN